MARTVTRKRKSQSEAPAQEPEAKKRLNSSGCTGSHFPFLSLPLELRDEIYKHIIMSDEAATSLQKQNLVTKTGLVGVNGQICQEFLDALLFHVPVIETTVRNHNFAHVVTFLNRLSEAQFRRISSKPGGDGTTEDEGDTSNRTPRKIRITLVYSATKQSTRAQLNRWLDRFDDPDRRGKEIEFEYVVDFGTYSNGGGKQRPRFRATAGEASNNEAARILRAGRNRSRYGW